MTFQPVPDVAQITVEGRQDGQMTINDLYFAISGGGITPVNLNGITLAVSTWANGSLAPQLSEDWALVRCTGRDLTVVDGPVAVDSQPATGGIASEALPNNVAACVSFRTQFGGRSFRGRNYVPGIPSPAVLLNTMSDAFMSNLLVVYNALTGAGDFLPGWEWVVVSRRTANAPRPTGIASPVMTASFTTPYVRSMRSREIGHGS